MVGGSVAATGGQSRRPDVVALVPPTGQGPPWAVLWRSHERIRQAGTEDGPGRGDRAGRGDWRRHGRGDGQQRAGRRRGYRHRRRTWSSAGHKTGQEGVERKRDVKGKDVAR